MIDSKCLWWSTTCQREKGACRAFDKYGLRKCSTNFSKKNIFFLVRVFIRRKKVLEGLFLSSFSAAFVTIIFVLKCLALLSYTFGIYHVDKLSHLKQKGSGFLLVNPSVPAAQNLLSALRPLRADCARLRDRRMS